MKNFQPLHFIYNDFCIVKIPSLISLSSHGVGRARMKSVVGNESTSNICQTIGFSCVRLCANTLLQSSSSHTSKKKRECVLYLGQFDMYHWHQFTQNDHDCKPFLFSHSSRRVHFRLHSSLSVYLFVCLCI